MKGKGAGVSGGIPLAGIRGRAPSTLPRAFSARGIEKSNRRPLGVVALPPRPRTYTFKQLEMSDVLPHQEMLPKW